MALVQVTSAHLKFKYSSVNWVHRIFYVESAVCLLCQVEFCFIHKKNSYAILFWLLIQMGLIWRYLFLIIPKSKELVSYLVISFWIYLWKCTLQYILRLGVISVINLKTTMSKNSLVCLKIKMSVKTKNKSVQNKKIVLSKYNKSKVHLTN